MMSTSLDCRKDEGHHVCKGLSTMPCTLRMPSKWGLLEGATCSNNNTVILGTWRALKRHLQNKLNKKFSTGLRNVCI